MSWRNRVVWYEGLFLQPQHFQQHDRYLERHVNLRTNAIRSHGWGFEELEINRELLAVGKLAIVSAKGVFPDGTSFSMPEDDSVPPALDVDPTARDLVAYLAVPIQKNGEAEVARESVGRGETRLVSQVLKVRDVSPDSTETVDVEVSSTNSRILLEGSVGSDRSCIPLAKIVQVRSDGAVEVAPGFMPTVLSVRAAPALDSFLTELVGMLNQRGDQLASIAVSSTKGQAGELVEFMLLQAINRWEPLITHLQREIQGRALVHPEAFFQLCLQLIGDLAALSFESRRPGVMPAYVHRDLLATFNPVMTSIRTALGSPIESRTISIPLEEKRYGIRVGVVGDRRRLTDSDFVLALRADEAPDSLARRVPGLVTVAASERIVHLVNGQQPGIKLDHIQPPREIPVHRGYLYFRLDDKHAEWEPLANAAGLAIHIPDTIPGVDLQLWAIRR